MNGHIFPTQAEIEWMSMTPEQRQAIRDANMRKVAYELYQATEIMYAKDPTVDNRRYVYQTWLAMREYITGHKPEGRKV